MSTEEENERLLGENQEEWWKEEDYYESHIVKKGKKIKICARCGKYIEVGESSVTHKFYPEFASAHTHLECTEAFKEALVK